MVLGSPGMSSRVEVAQRGFGGHKEGLLSPPSRIWGRCRGDSRKLQQKGAFIAQYIERNYKFLNLFWMDSSVLFLAILKLFSFQLLLVLTPFKLQHEAQDPDESWHL